MRLASLMQVLYGACARLERIANHCRGVAGISDRLRNGSGLQATTRPARAPRAPIPSQEHWCAGRTLPYIGAQTALGSIPSISNRRRSKSMDNTHLPQLESHTGQYASLLIAPTKRATESPYRVGEHTAVFGHCEVVQNCGAGQTVQGPRDVTFTSALPDQEIAVDGGWLKASIKKAYGTYAFQNFWRSSFA